MNNIIRYSTAGFLLCTPLLAAALELNVSPGTLAGALTGNTDTELRLTGSIDVRDLIALAENPGAVTALDLSDVNIEAYTYHRPLWQGHTWFPAGELPEYIFMGAPFVELKLPATLTVLGEGALAASALESLTLPASLRQVGEFALYSCTSLRNVDMSASHISELPAAMFKGCGLLNEISLPSVLRSVGSEVFTGTSLRHLELSGVSYFADFALSGMEHLESVVFDSHADFGRGVLMGAVRLERLEGAPSDVPDLFTAHCTALDADAVVSGATVLGDCCVASAGGVRLHLADDLSEVGAHVFDGMRHLKDIDATTLGSRIPGAVSGAFDGIDCSSISLIVGDDYQDLWRADEQWGRFNICTVSGVDRVVAEESSIRLTMQSDCLTVYCAEGIDEVTVYSAEGLCLYTASPGGAAEVTVDCSAFDSSILVAGAHGGKQCVSRKFLVQK
ncbi:MAG: leucine-rich repeat domain-containing protein [Muribaculaceae bacterium]|nr:leucine-rich repeat domain-containing protein [Muribaculaceae bacterium]